MSDEISKNVFLCGECKDQNSMEMAEFKEHLRTVHNITPDQIKGTKEMVMHMNGSGFHAYTYEWTLLSGIKFMQFIQRPKGK